MKNQYVGDIGDYGKYISYLENEKEKVYDAVVYDFLKKLVRDKDKNVQKIEKSGIISNALYFSDVLNTTDFIYQRRKSIREAWHKKAMEKLNSAQLIFADPDNGTIGAKSPTSKDAEKYTTLEELADYYNRGQDVVYYCQKERWTDAQWEDKKSELKSVISDVKTAVLTFRRGTQRSYIFGIHPERYREYDEFLNRFIKTEWGTVGRKKLFERER